MINKTIPKYIQQEKVKNFTGINIETPETIPQGGVLELNHSNNVRQVVFEAPKKGILIGTKSRIIMDITLTDSGTNDTHPFDHSTSLFSNKYYRINGKAVCNNGDRFNYFNTLMSNVHYDSDFVSGSSGYKWGVNQSTLATGSTLRVEMPLVNAKYLDEEDLLKDSLHLDHISKFEVVLEIPSLLSDICSGANATNIVIKPKIQWYIVHSSALQMYKGVAPYMKSYTRYHYENRVIEAGTTLIQHSFIPKFANLKYIILCQRAGSVVNGSGTGKYDANFIQNSMTSGNLYIDGRPQFNNDLELDKYITYIDLMEKTFGRDIKKSLGSYMDFTQSSNSGKVFLCLPLSLDNKNSSGKNTKDKNKSVELRLKCNVSAQTYFEYFLVYTEIAQVNPSTKTYNVLT